MSAKNNIFKLSEKQYYYYATRDDLVKDISEKDNLDSLNGCLVKKELFDKIGTLDFENNKSSIVTVLEKADKAMIKNSDYLVKVVD